MRWWEKGRKRREGERKEEVLWWPSLSYFSTEPVYLFDIFCSLLKEYLLIIPLCHWLPAWARAKFPCFQHQIHFALLGKVSFWGNNLFYPTCNVSSMTVHLESRKKLFPPCQPLLLPNVLLYCSWWLDIRQSQFYVHHYCDRATSLEVACSRSILQRGNQKKNKPGTVLAVSSLEFGWR